MRTLDAKKTKRLNTLHRLMARHDAKLVACIVEFHEIMVGDDEDEDDMTWQCLKDLYDVMVDLDAIERTFVHRVCAVRTCLYDRHQDLLAMMGRTIDKIETRLVPLFPTIDNGWLYKGYVIPYVDSPSKLGATIEGVIKHLGLLETRLKTHCEHEFLREIIDEIALVRAGFDVCHANLAS